MNPVIIRDSNQARADRANAMSAWKKVSDYAITNGPQAISVIYSDGCSMYRLHENDVYKKYSEDECEVVVLATYPDVDSMRSYLATGGLSKIGNLLDECRAAWAKRKAEAA